MLFQAYLENIKTNTGKSTADFKKLAEEKGFIVNGKLNPETKAGEVVTWLKREFRLGHSHSMALYASLKGRRK